MLLQLMPSVCNFDK